MSAKQLGRLEKVNLRDFWLSEAGDFTPWLAREENIRLLGEVIGLDLEVEAQEQSVGPFRADILCKDTGNGHWVLIENQLAKTDHTHLGQLLTYAAGLDAVSIVWISAQFVEQHRAALDWLNEITDERFNFFGLEVELWRIGDSLAAPKFDLVSKPNSWTRAVSGAARGIAETPNSDTQRLQLEFWTGFRGYMEKCGSPVRPTKPLPQSYMSMAIGRAGFGLSAVISTWNFKSQAYSEPVIRAEFAINNVHADRYFGLLKRERDTVESEFGEQLEWHSQDDVRLCRIYVERRAEIDRRENWSEYFEWLRSMLEALQKVFRERVRTLDAEKWRPDSAIEPPK